MRSRSLLMVLAMSVVAVPGSTTASAQPVAPGEPQISVYLKGLRNTGGVGGWAGETKRFAVGEPFTMFLVSGNLANGSGCSIGGYSSKPFEELISSYAHVWRISVTPIAYAAGQQKMSLHWARFGTGSADKPTAGGTQELTLNQGDRQVLDFLHLEPTSGNCRWSAVMLDVAAGYKEDAAYADAMLKYELWLVHTNDRGEKITRQFVTMGRQGGEMTYEFPPLRLATPALSAATRQYDVTLSIGGALRGRLTTDGRIVVELTTDRRDALSPPAEADRVAGVYSESPRGDTGSGRKVVEVAEGETIAVKIPSRSGVSSVRAGDASLSGSGSLRARPGVAATQPTEPIVVDNGRITIYWKQFLQGHETSLILKVTRVQ